MGAPRKKRGFFNHVSRSSAGATLEIPNFTVLPLCSRATTPG
jgi:hypothetical protein